MWFAIGDASTGRVLGCCDLRRPDCDDPALGEVGYALDPTARGRGYATRAVGLLRDWGFDDLRIRRIQALVHPDNPRSARVLERLDLSPEGLLRQYRAHGSNDGTGRCTRYSPISEASLSTSHVVNCASSPFGSAAAARAVHGPMCLLTKTTSNATPW